MVKAIYAKRYRGPKILRPFESALVRTTRHLPHWASRLTDAIDRAVFDTTVIAEPGNPPPPAGVREPRRPKPTAPATSQALREPSTD